MNERLDALSALEELLRKSGLQIVERQHIACSVQIVLTDGLSQVPLNVFINGHLTFPGKPSGLRAKLTAWAKQQEAPAVRLQQYPQAECDPAVAAAFTLA